MKLTKRAISLLLTLLIVVSCLPGLSLTASAATYDIWIRGSQVNDGNRNDVLGDGTVRYNPTLNTLYLTDASLNANDGTYGETVLYAGGSLTIELEGSSYLSNAPYGVRVQGDLYVHGSGTLRTVGADSGIYVGGKLILDDEEACPTVITEGSYYGIRARSALLLQGNLTTRTYGYSTESTQVPNAGLYVYGGKLELGSSDPRVFRNSLTLDLNGLNNQTTQTVSPAIYATGGIELSPHLNVTAPAAYSISADHCQLLDGAGAVAVRVAAAPRTRYRILTTTFNADNNPMLPSGSILTDQPGNRAFAGQLVTLTFQPDEDLLLTGYACLLDDEVYLPVTQSGDSFTFVMPAQDVEVYALFTEYPLFSVTVADGIHNGTVEVTRTLEDEVTLRVTPDAGYKLKSLTVTDSAGDDVPYTAGENNTYTLVDALYDDVTVNAEFELNRSLWVCGTEVTTANCANILGNGKASFDPVTSTLTLNGLTSTSNLYESAVIWSSLPTLHVTGTGSIATPVTNGGRHLVTGIHAQNTELTLSGSLAISAHEVGVYAKNVTVKDGGVSVTTTVSNGYGILIDYDTLRVLDGTSYLNVDSSFSIAALGVELGDSLHILTPAGGTPESIVYGVPSVRIATGTPRSVTVDTILRGTVTADKTEAIQGETVTLTATPDAGCSFSSVTVKDANNNSIAVTNNSFVMPDSDVTVTANFTINQPSTTETYDLWVFGTQVSSANCRNILKDGKFSYNPATQTLYVNGFGGIGTDPNPFLHNDAFVNTNTIDLTIEGYGVIGYGGYEDYALRAPNRDITIRGDLTLDGYWAIEANSLTVDGGDVLLDGYNPNQSVLISETVTVTNRTTRLLIVAGRKPPMTGTLVLDTLMTSSQYYDSIHYGQALDIQPIADYPVTINVTGGGRVTAASKTGYVGRVVELNLKPNDGYALDSLTVTDANGANVAVTIVGEQAIFTMPNSEATVSAVFKQGYALQIATATHGSVSAPSPAYAPGETVNLTVNADGGYELAELCVFAASGVPVTVTNNSFVMPDCAVVVAARFDRIRYAVNAAEAENGSFTLSRTTAAEGELVTVTPTPNTGYAVGSITVKDANNNNVTVTDGSFFMPASSVTVSVSFVQLSYTVTVQPPEHGSLSASVQTAHYGDVVTVTATPDVGYKLSSVSAVNTDGGHIPVANNRFTMPDSNVTVSAVFVPIDYTVTVNPAEHGSLTASPTTAHYGDTVTLTPYPDTGYTLSSVLTDPALYLTFQTVGLTALRGSDDDNEGIRQLVDGNINTKWGITQTQNPYIILKAAEPFRLSEYTLTTANDTARYPGRNWKNWSIYGANFDSDDEALRDAAQWQLVAAVENDTTLKGVNLKPFDFTLNEPAGIAYQYYMIVVTANKSANNNEYTQMAELSMRGYTRYVLTPDELTFTMPAYNVALTPQFAPIDYAVTVKQTAHGTASADCETAHYGDVVTLSATPEEGYLFAGWTVIDTDRNPIPVTNGQFTMPASAVTVTPEFAIAVYTIAIPPTEHGAVTANRNMAHIGDEIILTVTPDEDYMLMKLTVYDFSYQVVYQSTEAGENTFTMPATNLIVVARFAVATYPVTVAEVAHGTVTADKSQAAYGETVTLTVTPDPGYLFGGLTVTDAEGNSIPVENGQFPMPKSAVTVTAGFTAIDYTVTVEDAQNGTVTADKATAHVGDAVTLTLTPDAGYELVSVQVTTEDGEAVPMTDDSFVMPDANVTVRALFMLYEEFDLWLGATRVTTTNAADIYGDGSASYDPATQTLRLNNFAGTVGGHSFEYRERTLYTGSLNLTVVGSGNLGLRSGTTMTGITAPNSRVTLNGNFTLKTVYECVDCCQFYVVGGTFTCNTTNNQRAVAYRDGSQVVIENGTEWARFQANTSNNNTVIYSSSLTIGDDLVRTNPQAGVVLISRRTDFAIRFAPMEHGAASADVPRANPGETVTLSYAPDAGYFLDAFTVTDADGNDVPVENNQFTMPAAAVTVAVSFRPVDYAVHVETEHGAVTTSQTVAHYGDAVTLTVIPDAGYQLGTLTVTDAAGDPVAVSANNTFIMPESDVTVTAVFVARRYSIKLLAMTHGSVTAEPASAAAGELVTLTVTPEEHYTLNTLSVVDLNGDPVELDGTQFLMPDSNVFVIATFRRAPYSVTVEETSHGTVTASLTAADAGEKGTLTVTPDTGYELTSLSVADADGTSVPVQNNQFTMPASDVTVTATFTVIDYTVTVQASGNGTVSADREIAHYDDTIVLTLAPAEDHRLESLTVKDADGNEISVTDGQFAMPAADVTVTASFEHNHKFGEPVWTWTENYGAATVSFPCTGCDVTKTLDAAITVDTTLERTQYTATVTFEGAEYDDVKTIYSAWDIWVGGNYVTGENCADVLGNGTVCYDRASNTLTLNNAVIEITRINGGGSAFGIRSNDSNGTPLTVMLVGRNQIVDQTVEADVTDLYGFAAYASTPGYVFTGGGSLEIRRNESDAAASFRGIHVRKALTLSGVSVDIVALGSIPTVGVELRYSDSVLRLKDSAMLSIQTGGHAESYALARNSNGKNVEVAAGCVLIARSDHSVTNGNIQLTDATAALGAWVSTQNDQTTLSAWNGSTALNSYRYLIVPHFGHFVIINQSTNGTMAVDKRVAEAGQTVTLLPAPNAGYELDSCTVTDANGNPVPVENNQFTMPDANVTVTASFAKATYTVTLEQPGNGTITADKTAAQMGDVITLTAAPDEGYELDAFIVTDANGTPVPVTNDRFTMPGSNVTVSASFRLIGYTVSVNQPGNGTVTADRATAHMGDKVTLTAAPDAGYTWASYTVTDENGNPVPVTNGKFTMPAANVSVTASFTAIDYTVTLQSAENGAFTADRVIAHVGETVTLTAAPIAGYEYAGCTVTYGNGQTVPVANGQFTMPAANVTVTASFTAIRYTVAVGELTNGSVTTDKSTAHVGETVTLTAAPDAGYTWESYAVTDEDGNAVPVTDGKLTMPAANVTVTASFTAIDYTVTVQTAANGVLTADREIAHVGETVTLTAAPDAGYELEGFTVTDGNGKTVPVTDGRFTMPAGSVTVTPQFDIILVKYDLWLGGTQVTSKNAADIYGDGAASYDPATQILTLNNFAGTVGGYEFEYRRRTLYTGSLNLTIVGSGNLGPRSGVQMGGITAPNSRVTLNGTFRIKTVYECVDCKQFYVVGGTFNGQATSYARAVAYRAGARVVIENGAQSARFQANGGNTSQIIMPSLTLGSDLVKTNPSYGVILIEHRSDHAVQLAETQHGAVSASLQRAAKGTVVTLTVTPDEGWELASLTVTDANGSDVPASGEHNFTMPDSDVTVTASFRRIHFVGNSLSLEGDIGINFYVKLYDVAPDSARMVFRWGVGEEAETETVSLASLTADAAGRYKLTARVAAAQMTDTVTAELYDGQTLLASQAYSVAQYARYVIDASDEALLPLCGNQPEKVQSLRSLCQSMLIYGAKSQLLFEYHQEDLADQGLGYTLQSVGALGTTSFPEGFAQECGIEYYGGSLVLDSKTSYRLYFTVTDQKKLDALTVKLGEQTLTYETWGDLICFEISDIPAAQVFKDHTLRFGSIEITANAGAYVTSALASDNEPLADTMTALYWYSMAAKAYFGAE